MKGATGREPATSVFPVMRYRNVAAAVDWLCDAFGFERHRITTDNDGAIVLAQLTFGTAMVMLGPVRKAGFDRYLKQPDEIGGAETQVCYCSVADVHAHFLRAKAAGAEILFDLEDRTNGGRSYSCRDLEGHVWNFGTYDPWRPPSGSQGKARGRLLGSGTRRLACSGGLFIAAAALVIPTGGRPDLPQGTFRSLVAAPAPDTGNEMLIRVQLDRESDAGGAATALETEEQTSRTHSAMNAAREVPTNAQAQPGDTYDDDDGKEAGDPAHTEIRKQLEEALRAKEAAERAAAELQERLVDADRDKEAAQRAAKTARDKLVSAWIGKTAAERAARAARRRLIRERKARCQTANPPGNAPLFPLW